MRGKCVVARGEAEGRVEESGRESDHWGGGGGRREGETRPSEGTDNSPGREEVRDREGGKRWMGRRAKVSDQEGGVQPG